MPNYLFDKYRFQVETSVSESTRKALVFCAQGSTTRGWLCFYSDDETIPGPTLDAQERITLSFPISRFDGIMALLRNETPLYIYYYSPTFAGISSASEPVGEEET